MEPGVELSFLKIKEDSRDTKIVLWFSRIFRWMIGSAFIIAGLLYWNKGGWPAMIFGVVIFVTGFFRPKRCLEEGQCEINSSGRTEFPDRNDQ